MPGTSSIDGINSGLNTTAIVDAIMAFERRPVDLLEIRQTETTNIVSAFKALQAKVLALNTQIASLSRVSTFNAASVDVSDDTYLAATASGRVGAGSYDVQVKSLARNHTLASQGFADESTSSFGTGTIKIKLGTGSQQTITIDSSNNSLVGIKKAINDANTGVLASIINDGSSSQNYRLVLTADKTGITNKISITSSLTGGSNLNYSTSAFDNPEMLITDSGSSSAVSLGATAAYTGSSNKIYTFTAAGTGAQTIGTDNITLNWTDGTNSGSIIVTQADTEVDLAGTGSDGLKLSFGSGIMTAGDSFQVTTFAPLLQDASDAQITFGSSGGTGSPITVTSDTNTFTGVVAGLTIVAKKETTTGTSVTITTDTDTGSIRNEIKQVIDKYNDVMKYIDDQNNYDKDTKESGVLFADRTVQLIQSSIRTSFGSSVKGITSKYNHLFAIGVRTGTNGQLSIRDGKALDDALKNNLDDVIKLFTESGNTSINGIEFVSATDKTSADTKFDVDITQAATHGRFQGSGITDPSTTALTLNSSNNQLKFTIDGIISNDIVLTQKTYNTSTELVNEVQAKIDADDKIGSRGLKVAWVSTGTGTGYLDFTNSTYGSSSTVKLVTSIPNPALTILGLSAGASHDGLDVAGTINSEAAVGQGQYLIGKEGNPKTEGLKLKVTLDTSQVNSAVEGNVTLTKGVSAKLNDLLDSLTANGDGMFDRRITAYQNQIENLKIRIKDWDKRLAIRRDHLFERFLAQEKILGTLKAQSGFLNSQLVNIAANWGAIRKN